MGILGAKWGYKVNLLSQLSIQVGSKVLGVSAR